LLEKIIGTLRILGAFDLLDSRVTRAAFGVIVAACDASIQRFVV
jgi:hypothetical protein